MPKKVRPLPKSKLIVAHMPNGAAYVLEANQNRKRVLAAAVSRFKNAPTKSTKKYLDSIGVTGYHLAMEGARIRELKTAGYRLGDILKPEKPHSFEVDKKLGKTFSAEEFLRTPALAAYLKRRRIHIDVFLRSNYGFSIEDIRKAHENLKRKGR